MEEEEEEEDDDDEDDDAELGSEGTKTGRERDGRSGNISIPGLVLSLKREENVSAEFPRRLVLFTRASASGERRVEKPGSPAQKDWKTKGRLIRDPAGMVTV